MHWTGLLVIGIGAVGIVLGARGYLSRGEAGIFQRRNRGRFQLGPGPHAPLTFLLDGIGLALVGVAISLPRTAVTIAIVWVGCAVIAAAVLIYMFRPGWARPRWMSPRRK